MWEWGRYTAWMSPDHALATWLLALALVLLLAARHPAAANSLKTVIGATVAMQSVILLVGLIVGNELRARGENPSSVYAQASICYGVAWLTCVLLLSWRVATRHREAAPTSTSSLRTDSTALPVVLRVSLGILVLAIVTTVVLIGRRFALFPERMPALPVGVLRALFVLTAVGGATLAWRARNWQAPIVSRAEAALACGLVLLAALVVEFCFGSVLETPLSAMTDAALIASYWPCPDGSLNLFRSCPADPLDELAKRPRGTGTDADFGLRSWRTRLGTERSLSAQASRLAERAGTTHSEDWLPFEWSQWHRYPELDVLRVLIGRGQVQEAKAWLDDPAVPPELKKELAELLETANQRRP